MRFGWAIAFGLSAWLGCSLGATLPARAVVRIDVDLGGQMMRVAAASGETHEWPISSGRPGRATPRGEFRPTALYPMVYSFKYGNEPMPHSIFFRGQYAIHGTYESDWLGQPASHGCIRLAPSAAATLYGLVAREGAVIRIGGAAEPAPHLVSFLLARPGGRILEVVAADPLELR